MPHFDWFTTGYSAQAISARRKLADTWVYYVRAGQQVRRRYIIPTDPRTPAQILQRGILRQAVWSWRDLTPAQVMRYNQRATRTPGWTGFNLFIREYITDY